MEGAILFGFHNSARSASLRENASSFHDEAKRDHRVNRRGRDRLPVPLGPRLLETKLQAGLVLNIGLEPLKEGITRIVHGLPEGKESSRRGAENAEEGQGNA